eukprot:scaffold2910_cov390-Prasinococcus_capsulatus_cf.AAC.5
MQVYRHYSPGNQQQLSSSGNVLLPLCCNLGRVTFEPEGGKAGPVVWHRVECVGSEHRHRSALVLSTAPSGRVFMGVARTTGTRLSQQVAVHGTYSETALVGVLNAQAVAHCGVLIGKPRLSERVRPQADVKVAVLSRRLGCMFIATWSSTIVITYGARQSSPKLLWRTHSAYGAADNPAIPFSNLLILV